MQQPRDAERAAGLPKPPRAITFDCWQTLIVEDDWQTAHGLRVEAVIRAAAAAGHRVSPERARHAFDLAWARHMELWAREVASGAPEIARWSLEELGVDPRGAHHAELVTRFEDAGHSGRVRALAGAQASLVRLDEAGIPCGLICDTGLTPGRVVRELLGRVGLLERLRVTIFSDEWSLPKPHPRVFRAALDALGAQAGDAVHVGDLRRTDVAGARAVGMGTVRLRAAHDDRTPLPDADLVVDSHAELLVGLGVAPASP